MSTRREDIVAAARAQFAHYGYARTTMSNIAEAAGVSRTALYRHYSNREDVFRAVSQSLFDQFLDHAEEAAQGSGDFTGRMAGILLAKVTFLEILRGSAHGAELMALSAEVAADLRETAMARFRALLSAVVRDGVDRGEVDIADASPDAVALVLIRAVDGLAHAPGSHLESPEAFQEQLGLLARMVCRGIVRNRSASG